MFLTFEDGESYSKQLKSVVFSGEDELEVVGTACDIMAYDGLHQPSRLCKILVNSPRFRSRRLIIAERTVTTAVRRVLRPWPARAEEVVKQVDKVMELSKESAENMNGMTYITPRLRLEGKLATLAMGCIYDYAEAYAFDNPEVDRLSQMAERLAEQSTEAGYIPGAQVL